MKKIFLILIFFVCIVELQAQEKVRRKYAYRLDLAYRNVVKINPLSLFLGNVSLSYERVLSEKVSVQLQGGYWIGGKVEGTKWTGFSLTPEVRYYLTDHLRPEGAYLAAFGRYQEIQSEIERSESQIAIKRIGGGASAGYQFVLGERVSWDTFLGVQYLSNSVDKDGVSSAKYGLFTGNMGVRFGTTLGIAF
jgi:hypothetical protein